MAINAEELRVTLSASGGATVERSLSEVQDASNSLRLAIGRLGNRLEGLGDELTQTGARAVGAAAGITGYTAATNAATGASATWSATMTASLIPALGALSLTLAPLVVTLGGVAAGATAVIGAFSAIVGSGFLAYGRQLAGTMEGVDSPTEALAKRFGQLRQEIANIIAPLGSAFIPLIRDGLNALPDLVRAIVDSLGPLDQFANTLRRLGRSAMTIIPQITGAMMDLARRALPVFESFVAFVGQRGPQAFTLLVESFRRTRDEFAQLLGATVSALPPLLRLGNTVTTVLVPALSGLISGLGRAVAVFNDLPRPLRRGATAAGLLGSAFVVAVPAVTAIAGAISALLGPLGAAVIAISTLAGAWVADIGGMRKATARVFGAIQTEVRKTFRTINTITDGALRQLTTTIRSFATAAQSNFGQIVTYLSTQFIAGIQTVGRTIRTTLRSLERVWNTHGQRVRGIVQQLTTFLKRNPRRALTTLATVIVPGPLASIVQAFRRNWAKVQRATQTTMTQLQRTTRTAMQAINRQIVTELTNTQSRTAQTLTQIQTEFSQTWTIIQSIVSRVLGILLTIQTNHTQKVGALWRQHLSGPNGILANARTAFNTLWTNIIQPTLNIIQAGWRMFGDEILAITRFSLEAILAVSRRVTDLLLTTINVTLDLISGDWQGAWTNIRAFTERTLTAILNFSRRWGSRFLSWLRGVLADALQSFRAWANNLIFGSLIPRMFGAILSAARSFGSTLVSTLSGALSDVVSAFRSALSRVESMASSIISSARNASSTADSALNDARDALDDARDAAQSALNVDVSGGGDGGDDDGGGGGGGGSGGGGSVSAGSGGGGGGDLTAFATGGLTRGEGLAYLHPNEAVLPVDAGADALVDAMSGGGGGGDTQQVLVVKDNEFRGIEDGEDVIKTLEREGASVFRQ